MWKINPIWFYDFSKELVKKGEAFSRYLLLTLNFMALLLVMYQTGFRSTEATIEWVNYVFLIVIILNFVSLAVRLTLRFLKQSKKKVLPADVLLLFLLLSFILYQIFGHNWVDDIPWYEQVDHSPNLLKTTVVILFLIDLSKSMLSMQRISWHPSILFGGSFLFLIAIGTGFLLLPNATTNGISFTDALFTSTSAVCVTGLIVVDTSTAYTSFGQTLIMVLFQIGGLGIMTFTSFFGFFFKGGASYQSAIALRDIVNEQSAGRIASTLFKIITFTVLAELLGALFIFNSLDSSAFGSYGERVKFSVFHSISAFCNAGFSTLSNGLYEEVVRTNYSLHMIAAVLIIIGGLGFPVIIDLYYNLKVTIVKLYNRWRKTGEYFYRTHMKVHTKLALWTTGILLLFGFVSFLVFEEGHTLAGLSFKGKMATSIFGAVTPRTAGFNTVDMTGLALPTVLIYLLLMWIGASPGSTGGGLKTTTFAVALLNTFSLAKNKDRVEVFRREISNSSVRKALSVVLLSQIVIGIAIITISALEPQMTFTSIIFECFSAFSTVGLSLGITGEFSDPSKYVIMVVMFTGRVGTLTLLTAFFRKVSTQQYRYPKESVFIV